MEIRQNSKRDQITCICFVYTSPSEPALNKGMIINKKKFNKVKQIFRRRGIKTKEKMR
jgi:hypothetical protein